MNSIPTIEQLDVAGRRVFVRADFNVPLDAEQTITDDTRIQEVIPTLTALRERGARLILASHLGRPRGNRVPELSLAPVGERLAELLDCDILFPDDCVGGAPKKLARDLRDGQVMLLENLRFHPEEASGDEAFARKLAALCDVYVNDAFGTAHRAHASVVGVPRFVADKAAGLLLAREITALSELMNSPPTPFVAVLGGAKVSTKLPVIEAQLERVNSLLIGGAMANTFLAAKGHHLGASLVEPDCIHIARSTLASAANMGVELGLPIDHVIVEDLRDGATFEVTDGVDVPEGWMSVDIGPKTVELYQSRLASAKTVLWNGPMGVFEVDPFGKGTESVGRAVANSSARSIAGGGDTIAAVKKTGIAPFISHISTGGGASLEFLSGNDLPGIAALR